MNSIKDVYKIGTGPSSSHTMGPENAVVSFMKEYPDTKEVKVTLLGSLALTGRGHLTDWIIIETFKKYSVKCEVKFDIMSETPVHENTLIIESEQASWTIYSIGGGDIKIEGIELKTDIEDVYPHENIRQITQYCEVKNLNYSQYVYNFEPEIKDYLKIVWDTMKKSVESGLSKEGTLPGELKVARKAKTINSAADDNQLLISSYAYAVSEENASGNKVVTAPTCGACGVVPAILYHHQKEYGYSDEEIIDALAVAGLFGQTIKHNASISGAEAGCQAEVGSATSMAAVAICTLEKCSLFTVQAAGEIAMEHQLGLTCDPVKGYVQIPCIQRNAIGANKARLAAKLSKEVADSEKVDFDMVIKVMFETGKDMREKYRETAKGGIAKYYEKRYGE